MGGDRGLALPARPLSNYASSQPDRQYPLQLGAFNQSLQPPTGPGSAFSSTKNSALSTPSRVASQSWVRGTGEEWRLCNRALLAQRLG
jgi:hypothetical protein